MKKALLLFLLLLIIQISFAQLSQSIIGADSLKVGSRFTLKIDAGFPIKSIQIPDTLSSFQVLKQNIHKSDKGSTAELEIIPMRTGTLTFPKLKLKSASLLHPSDETDAFRVFVLRSRAESDTLLRDIKPLKEYKLQIPFILYLLGFSIVLISFFWLIFSFIPKKAKPLAPPMPIEEEPKPYIPAYRLALDAIDELEKSNLMESDVLAYHFRLSFIIREFIEAEYLINATMQTTFEIEESLRLNNIPNWEELIRILSFADGIKFALVRPGFAEIALITQSLKLYLMSFAALKDD